MKQKANEQKLRKQKLRTTKKRKQNEDKTMKTHSGAKKRFRLTGSGGKIKRKQRYVRHLLVNKSSKRKRQLGKTAYVSSSFTGEVKKLLGAG